MKTVCEICGSIGFKHLLLCCRGCKCSAVHQYCLDKVVFDASLADWLCYECLQRHGEVTCFRSLEVSTVQQSITKRMESASDAWQCQNSMDRAAMVSSKNTSHDNETNQHASAIWMNANVSCAKANNTVFGAHKNEYWADGSPRNRVERSGACGDGNSNVIDVLMLESEKEEAKFQLVCSASNDMQQRIMAANVPESSTLRSNNVEKVTPYSPSHGCERVFSCDGVKNIPSVQERNMDSVDISGSRLHDKAESSESSEIIVKYQKGSSYHNEKTVNRTAVFLSSQESGEDIPSENESFESDDLQASSGADYVLSRTSYLSKEQKKRVIALIQKSKPETTVFVAVMRKSNVQPPGPCLGISKEYAFAHLPHKSTNVTLQRPGKSKKWHPIFYKRNESRKNMLMGQWLDFVRENHVQEGDICLLAPKKGEGGLMFTAYLLRTTSALSRCGDGSQRDKPCTGGSIERTSSEVHMEEPTDGQHVSSESGMPESSHGSLDWEVSDGLPQPPYIVPCRSHLSKSQIRIVEKRVRAIQSEVPIYVAVMKNNNVGIAQRWMLELGSRYASVHLPAKGQTVVLQCRGKIWETKMMYHTGRRWTLNGGWPQFVRDNGLRVGDICLLELKKNERKLTMRVHIISREQF